MKKPIVNPALRTWEGLNEALMKIDEKEIQKLLKTELAGRRRAAFTKRIHARLNKVRADRERRELGEAES